MCLKKYFLIFVILLIKTFWQYFLFGIWNTFLKVYVMFFIMKLRNDSILIAHQCHPSSHRICIMQCNDCKRNANYNGIFTGLCYTQWYDSMHRSTSRRVCLCVPSRATFDRNTTAHFASTLMMICGHTQGMCTTRWWQRLYDIHVYILYNHYIYIHMLYGCI